MKTKHLSLITILFVTLITASCSKPYNTNDLIDDKNKIDIKGSMSNGDMRSPNIEAYMEGNTVWVYFYEDFGDCTISITSRDNSLVTCETIGTYEDASWRYFMGDEPLNRYHLVISNGTDEAEGWFFNFRFAAVRPKQ
ncbi:MAG: hypothetical protein IKN08_03635 [Bacteroidales bacterium]|nr:hypothetical protein [Bacteroidales bacterium]MBR6226856.1 hypothetical protein [Bacteroidales bacterium]